MSIERLAQLVTRRFGGVGTTRGSFFRIHAWAIAFLVAASALSPAHTGENRARLRYLGGGVQNLARAYGDQRAYVSSPYPRKQYFHIAWIQGSEGEVFRGELPVKAVAATVRDALPRIDGRPVVVDIYYFPGAFLGDEYLSLLDALAAKPDLVVFSLNPVWVLNPLAAHQWMPLDARAALELAGKPRDWPVAAAMFSPSDLGWGFAQSHLRPVAERTYWSTRIHDLVDKLGPLNRSKLTTATAAHKLTLTERVLHDHTYLFLFNRRLHLPAGTAALLTRRNMTPARWAQYMNVANEGHNQLNRLLLDAIARALKASGVPSYVYLSQINWLATDPAMGRTVSGIEHQLAGFQRAFTARNIRFQPKSASRFVAGMKFLPRDTVHLTATAGLGPYLARELCGLEAQLDKGATCTPIARPTGSG